MPPGLPDRNPGGTDLIFSPAIKIDLPSALEAGGFNDV